MKNQFDKIKLSHLYTFCNTLADTQVRNVSNIKRKYLETALAFDETLALLENLNIVSNKFDELFPSKTFAFTHDSIDDFKTKFLAALFSATGEISGHLRNFLLNFQIDINETYFKATEIQKIKFSDTRNLLLELEFISASDDNTTYYVNPAYIDLFVKQFSRKKLSPETLKRKQAENDVLGLAAEKAVIAFEIKRLTDISFNQSEIEHTSQENVSAGYDIKSFENCLDKNSARVNRYIEVKAVSVEDFKFYWSRIEMEIARVFGERYFLYLLPVASNNTFDFEKLMIVNNPFKNIYSDNINWDKQEESICLSKIR